MTSGLGVEPADFVVHARAPLAGWRTVCTLEKTSAWGTDRGAYSREVRVLEVDQRGVIQAARVRYSNFESLVEGPDAEWPDELVDRDFVLRRDPESATEEVAFEAKEGELEEHDAVWFELKRCAQSVFGDRREQSGPEVHQGLAAAIVLSRSGPAGFPLVEGTASARLSPGDQVPFPLALLSELKPLWCSKRVIHHRRELTYQGSRAFAGDRCGVFEADVRLVSAAHDTGTRLRLCLTGHALVEIATTELRHLSLTSTSWEIGESEVHETGTFERRRERLR
ncbi:MAG: hypothetical protein JKY65_11065 [Planctomycetes bacterium]|nr:hypothetical protein [Planctomycetota bacterium]